VRRVHGSKGRIMILRGASRHRQVGSDLATVAQEIATYIAKHGLVEATIIAGDEL